MRIKRILAVCLAAMMLVTLFAIPASAANTTDSEWHYYWDAARTQASYPRMKFDNSSTYFASVDSIPIGGVDFRTALFTGDDLHLVGYTSNYVTVINDGKYTIRHNRNGRGYEASIEARYPRERYSWGELTIKWSPDYIYEPGVIQIN